MSVIWLIEKPSAKPGRIADALIGDFAVRLFASLESFQKLLRLNRNTLPDLLLIHAESSNWTRQRLSQFMATHAPQTPCLVLGKTSDSSAQVRQPLEKSRVRWLDLPTDCLSLSRLVFATLANRDDVLHRAGAVMNFKDVLLDCERFLMRVLPEDQTQSLPLKEAQILRMLLEKPGICLSRQQIIEHLWEGVRVTPRTIDSHVSRLRKRLEGAEVQIESIYGGGYILR